MMDLPERLRTYMDSEVSTTRITNLGDVMERGERLRRRRRVLSAALPAAAVLMVVAGVVLPRQEAGDVERDLADVDAVAAAAARLSVQPASLDWEVQPATLGWQQQNVTSDGILYALSTAPGVRWEDFPNGDLPKAIYASTDGRNWTSHPLGGSWVSSIAAADGLLYAVGTGAGAEADSATLRIGISSDQGETFDGTEIPLGGNDPVSLSTNVAATGEGVLVTATSRASTDPLSLLPPDALDGGVEPLMLDGGIAVLPLETFLEAEGACFGQDPARCEDLLAAETTRFFSWDDLGLEGEEVMFGEAVTHSAYWSEDGHTFEEVDYPFPEGFIDQVFSLPGKVAVSLGGDGQTKMFVSEDARTWRPLAGVPAVGWVTAMGEMDGSLVIVGQSPEGESTSVFTAPDLAGPWEEISVEDLLDLPVGEETFVWATAATVGESGVAINVSVENVSDSRTGNPIMAVAERVFGSDAAPAEDARPVDVTSIMLLSRDLTSWSAVPSSELGGHIDSLLTAPDGRLLAHASGVGEDGLPARRQYSAQP